MPVPTAPASSHPRIYLSTQGHCSFRGRYGKSYFPVGDLYHILSVTQVRPGKAWSSGSKRETKLLGKQTGRLTFQSQVGSCLQAIAPVLHQGHSIASHLSHCYTFTPEFDVRTGSKDKQGLPAPMLGVKL